MLLARIDVATAFLTGHACPASTCTRPQRCGRWRFPTVLWPAGSLEADHGTSTDTSLQFIRKQWGLRAGNIAQRETATTSLTNVISTPPSLPDSFSSRSSNSSSFPGVKRLRVSARAPQRDCVSSQACTGSNPSCANCATTFSSRSPRSTPHLRGLNHTRGLALRNPRA
jgi:hypothetical protein